MEHELLPIAETIYVRTGLDRLPEEQEFYDFDYKDLHAFASVFVYVTKDNQKGVYISDRISANTHRRLVNFLNGKVELIDVNNPRYGDCLL